MIEDNNFGRLAARSTSVSDLLAIEKCSGRCQRFAQLDTLVGDLICHSLRGERLVALDRGRETDMVALAGIDDAHQIFVENTFSIAEQQASGAWFLPEEVRLNVGVSNLPYHFRHHPRFALGIAAEERARVYLQHSADGLLLWAILDPFFTQLFRPFELRGPLLGLKDPAWQRQAWQDTEGFLNALGLDASQLLAPVCYGVGWAKLRAPEQQDVKQVLMTAFAVHADPSLAARYRAYCIRALIAAFYSQAEKGPSTLHRVLTKKLQPILAGYFGGDWLAFLDYLGEPPHPDERISTALPEPRVFLGERTQVKTVAAVQGLPVDEVERILASFWGAESTTSPMEARVTVLLDFWREFDAIHARQQPGMQPLWGLIDDQGISLNDTGPYRPGLHQTLLTQILRDEIDHLWGTTMLARWPERVVSALSPNGLMAETFGPALKFWHGGALTAWFISEGPSSRTDIAGLPNYYQSEVAELERLRCPIPPELFTELARAQAQLGPPEPIWDSSRSIQSESVPGAAVTVRLSSGVRRQGFHLLRDIISRHRHAWCNQFRESYLRAR